MELLSRKRDACGSFPLSTGFTTFGRLLHDIREVRKRAPFFANFRARARKVDRGYVKWKGSPKPWYPSLGILVFSQKIEKLAVVRLELTTFRIMAFGPIGAARLPTYLTNTVVPWIPRTNVSKSVISRASNGLSGRIAFFHRDQTSVNKENAYSAYGHHFAKQTRPMRMQKSRPK